MTKSKYSYPKRNDEAQQEIIKTKQDGNPVAKAPNPAAVSLGPGAHDKITWEPKNLASPAPPALLTIAHTLSLESAATMFVSFLDRHTSIPWPNISNILESLLQFRIYLHSFV